MNKTNAAKQIDEIITDITALTPYRYVSKAPYNRGFKFIPYDPDRSFESDKDAFRWFTIVASSPATDGMFIESPSNSESIMTQLTLFVLYPLHMGDNTQRMNDIISADSIQIKNAIELSANRVVGCNLVKVTASSVQDVSDYSKAVVMTVDIHTRETV